MEKNLDLKATLIDENGKEHIYKPYAFMAYEGDHFIVMRSDDEEEMEQDVLVLKAENGKDGAVFNLVEEDKLIMKALYEGLGIGGQLLN